MFDVPYEVVKVPVPGGELAVGQWGRGDRVVVAAHGVTANHASFHALADALGPDVRLLAPDLRGRAGSRDLGGPYGMPAHAKDLVAVVDQLAGQPVTVVGHSMGGFVAVVAAARHPERFRSVVLVDGGLPLDLGPLADLPVEQLLQAVLGPSMERLRMRFATLEEYLDYWRPHPALARDWTPYVERYLAADLFRDGEVLRPSAREEAVVADTESDLKEGSVEVALQGLAQPVVHLRAPRGIMDQVPPLYPEASVQRWTATLPQLQTALVEDVNHFTVLLSAAGAASVAEHVLRGEGA